MNNIFSITSKNKRIATFINCRQCSSDSGVGRKRIKLMIDTIARENNDLFYHKNGSELFINRRFYNVLMDETELMQKQKQQRLIK